jgi:serine/threonine-protein kinase
MIGHPNVIHIHEVAEREDGTPYMVMEFLRGESLGERFEVEPTVPRALALSTLVAVSDALWAAHQKGIVHRDIKPDNLFLIGDPKAPEGVRVLDFGLSRLFQSKLTASGTVIGTPGYMAPEQVVADPVDQRTDIYGLGMVMYRMFTGRLPFESGGEHGSDTASILARQLFATPPHPSTLADVDKQIERVIMRAIRKQPENRYPSMQLLANDLRKLESGGEVVEYIPDRDKYELESAHSQMVAAGYRKLYDERS